MVQNGPNDHFGQNDLILNWILAFARPKWTILSIWPHFGLFRSANRTLAIPDQIWILSLLQSNCHLLPEVPMGLWKSMPVARIGALWTATEKPRLVRPVPLVV